MGATYSYLLHLLIDDKLETGEGKEILNIFKLVREIGLIMIGVYVCRIIIKQYIPKPFEGKYGFKSNNLEDINGGVILAFGFLLFMQEPIFTKYKIMIGSA